MGTNVNSVTQKRRQGLRNALHISTKQQRKLELENSFQLSLTLLVDPVRSAFLPGEQLDHAYDGHSYDVASNSGREV